MQRAVDEALPNGQFTATLPWCFGSQRYGLTGPKSDVDLLVVCPAKIVQCGDDIRAFMARGLCDRGADRHGIRDMRKLQTLKWFDHVRGTDVSLLVTDAANGQIQVTVFLRSSTKRECGTGKRYRMCWPSCAKRRYSTVMLRARPLNSF